MSCMVWVVNTANGQVKEGKIKKQRPAFKATSMETRPNKEENYRLKGNGLKGKQKDSRYLQERSECILLLLREKKGDIRTEKEPKQTMSCRYIG